MKDLSIEHILRHWGQKYRVLWSVLSLDAVEKFQFCFANKYKKSRTSSDAAGTLSALPPISSLDLCSLFLSRVCLACSQDWKALARSPRASFTAPTRAT